MARGGLLPALLLCLWVQCCWCMSFQSPGGRRWGLASYAVVAAAATATANSDSSNSRSQPPHTADDEPTIVAQGLDTARALGSKAKKVGSYTPYTLLPKVVKATKSVTKKVATAAVKAVKITEQLTYVETMMAGAISRTLAQTLMHPANTYKTVLQLKGRGSSVANMSFKRLLAGIDAQFLLSLPHGAFHFCAIDTIKLSLAQVRGRVRVLG